MIENENHEDCESLAIHVTSQVPDVAFPPVIGTLNESANVEVSLHSIIIIA